MSVTTLTPVTTRWSKITRFRGHLKRTKQATPTSLKAKASAHRPAIAPIKAVKSNVKSTNATPKGKKQVKREEEKEARTSILDWLHVDDTISLKAPSPVLTPKASPMLRSFSPSLKGLTGPRFNDGQLIRLKASVIVEPAKSKKRKLEGDTNVQAKSLEKKAKKDKQEKQATAVFSGKCDKCDGPHETDKCPIFKKARENHPDALNRSAKNIGACSGNYVLKQAKVVQQPGDGSCLFHSLAFGYKCAGGARSLRKEIAKWVFNHPDYKISDTPVRDWVKWDAGTSVQNYARSMASGGWGGGIEMASFSQMKRVNVHVFERRRGGGGGYKRISVFDVKGADKTVHVLYCGGVHYDALVPQGQIIKMKETANYARFSPEIRGGYPGKKNFGNSFGSPGFRNKNGGKFHKGGKHKQFSSSKLKGSFGGKGKRW